jgi:hypothetical protein
VLLAKIIGWADFDFMKYRGPSGYLTLCVLLGFFVLLLIGSFPFWLSLDPPAGNWTWKDFGAALLGGAFINSFLGFSGAIVALGIAWLVGLCWPGAADQVFRWLTLVPMIPI